MGDSALNNALGNLMPGVGVVETKETLFTPNTFGSNIRDNQIQLKAKRRHPLVN